MLKVNNLTKKYGKLEVLKGIDCEFEKGSISGIVGKNGAGKTTLFNCITSFEDFEGQIDYGEFNQDDISYAPAEPPIIERMTGEEYLRFLTLPRNINYDDFGPINIFDLPLQRYVESYSTGMKKKILLTGVFSQKSKILILDEPFNGVDLESNMIIHEILEKLRNKGLIIILSSHIFSALRDLCDQIIYLSDGLIKRAGNSVVYDEIEADMRTDFIDNRIDQFLDV
jgi:ABC-2 type transport system ATP-binding protein